MKLTTIAIAFGPAALVLVTKFALEPTWLSGTSFLACAAIGALIGAFGGLAVRIVEPRA